MDADYRRNLAEDGEFISEFQQSLYVLSTVQSTPEDGTRVVLDAGMKALSMDSGVPVVSSEEISQKKLSCQSQITSLYIHDRKKSLKIHV